MDVDIEANEDPRLQANVEADIQANKDPQLQAYVDADIQAVCTRDTGLILMANSRLIWMRIFRTVFSRILTSYGR